MSANNYLSPGQFPASHRSPAVPPVTPPTSAPTSATASGTNAASMWTFTKASQTAASQSGS